MELSVRTVPGKQHFLKCCADLWHRELGKSSERQKNDPRELLKKTYFVMQDADYQLFTESVTHEMELAARKNKQKNVRSSKEETTNILDQVRLGRILRKTPAILVRRTKASGHDCCFHRCKIGYSCFGRADEWA